MVLSLAVNLIIAASEAVMALALVTMCVILWKRK